MTKKEHRCICPKTVQNVCPACLNNPGYIAEKLHSLVDDTFPEDLVDRHVYLTEEFCKVSKDGILIYDLNHMVPVMEYFGERAKTDPRYTPLLLQILELCRLPPLVMDTCEESFVLPVMKNFFNVLGIILLSMGSNNELRIGAAVTAHSQLSHDQAPGVPTVKVEVARSAMEKSNLGALVGRALEAISDEVYPALLNLALCISSLSIKSMVKMARSGAVDHIMMRSCKPPVRGLDGELTLSPVWTPSLDEREFTLLWGLLRAIDILSETDVKPPRARALMNISYCLRNSAIDTDFEMANSLMSIILFCLKIFPELPIIEAGLAHDICVLAACSETGAKGTWAEPVKFRVMSEDGKFKQLLILSLHYIAKLPGAGKILRKTKALESLFILIHTQEESNPPNLQAQFISLMHTAMEVLITIATELTSEWVNTGGIAHMLQLVDWYCTHTMDYEKLSSSLEALCHITDNEKEKSYEQDVVDLGGFEIILRLCNHLTNNYDLSSNVQEVLKKGFIILEHICKNRLELLERYGTKILTLTTTLMDKAATHALEQGYLPLDDGLLVCAGAFIWESVVWCPDNLEKFIQKGYIYKIMDILQVSIPPVQMVLLGLLVDMAELAESITHIATWQYKNEGYLHLLLSIWRTEEKAISVLRDSNGCLVDVNIPLMGKIQRKQTFSSVKPLETSPCLVDFHYSARPKVFALYSLLQERYKDIRKRAEEYYNMHHPPLSTRDKITLEVVKHYLKFKLAEMWNENYINIRATGFIPLEIDEEVLQIINKNLKENAQKTLEFQHNMVEDEKNKEYQEEIHLRGNLEGYATFPCGQGLDDQSSSTDDLSSSTEKGDDYHDESWKDTAATRTQRRHSSAEELAMEILRDINA